MSEAAQSKPKKTFGMLMHDVMVFLISVGLIVVLQAGFIFFLFALLPSVVAFYIDDSRNKNVYKTILACNLAGMLPSLAAITQQKSSAAQLQLTMGDPAIWLIVYGSAGAGWALVWICRAFGLFVINIMCESRLHTLERGKKKLVDEWGVQVKHGE